MIGIETYFTCVRELNTGRVHYYMATTGGQRWDSFGRVDSRTLVEELDRETWEELKAEAEFFAELPALLAED